MSKNALIYCVTRTYVHFTAESLYSVLKHYSTQEPLDVLIVSDDLWDRDRDFIAALPQMTNHSQVNVQFVPTPSAYMAQIQDMLDQHPDSPAMWFWRLFVPFARPEYDRYLYLDNDTLVRGDIAPIFNMIDDDKPLAAARDFYYRVFPNANEQDTFNVQDTANYVNSGVILTNGPVLRATLPVQNWIDAINAGYYLFWDQTILNIVGESHIQFLPGTLNYQHEQMWLNMVLAPDELKQAITNEAPNVLIRHFAGGSGSYPFMPWDHAVVKDHWEAEYWQNVAELHQLSALYARNAHPDEW